MSEKRSVIFILDGGPMEGPCGLSECFDPSAGTYEVVDADTNQCYGAVQLCKKHGEQLATGPAA